MKVIDLINDSTKPFASFELVPPLKGSDISKLYNSIEPLMEFMPPFINVTTHRNEVEYRQMPDGNFKKFVVTKRPGTLAIAAAIMKRFPVEVVPHIICGSFTKADTEDLLLDLNFLDIHNVMALRGDPMPGEKSFAATPEGHRYSSELVKQISNMNSGEYLDANLKDAIQTDFCIGVGGYPEKHYESPNLDLDILHLKEKVDAGAQYIITQMFFDNSKYYNFVDKCREAGINVPIIPGIKPISTLKHIELLPRTFSIDIPQELMSDLVKCRDNSAIREVGIKWCISQCQDLLANGAKALHFYTMGNPNNVLEIIRKSF